MADIWTTHGLNQSLRNDLGIGAVNIIEFMTLTDFGALSATDDDISAATEKATGAFDSTPTLDTATKTATCTRTFPAADINNKLFTNICVHRANDYTEMAAGVDNQQFRYNGLDLKVNVQLIAA